MAIMQTVMGYASNLFGDWRGPTVAGALAGAIALSAAGCWTGSKAYSPSQTHMEDDPSKPKIVYVDVEKKVKEDVSYTPQKGDVLWRLSQRYYPEDKTGKQTADRINNVIVPRNREAHKHYKDHLTRDTKKVESGAKRAVAGQDKILGDDIFYGRGENPLVFPGVEKTVKVKEQSITGYEQKEVVDNPGSPSKADRYGWLGALLGALGGAGAGYGFSRWRGGAGGGGAGRPGSRVTRIGGGPNTIAVVAGLAGSLGASGAVMLNETNGYGAGMEYVLEKAEIPDVGAVIGATEDETAVRTASVVNLADFRDRRTLNTSERERVRKDITQRYLSGISVARAARDYVGLSTADAYSMLAENKLASTGTTYKWNKRLAETTGELAQVESMALGGTAKEAAARIHEATGFKISNSTIYRMRKQVAEKVAQERQVIFA